MPEFNQDKYYSLETALSEDPNNHIEECMRVAVKSIRNEALRQDGISRQLKTIITDLHEIRLNSKSAYETAMLLISMYPTSYGKIAKARGVSKPSVYNQVKRIAKKYPWVEQIFQLMSKKD